MIKQKLFGYFYQGPCRGEALIKDNYLFCESKNVIGIFAGKVMCRKHLLKKLKERKQEGIDYLKTNASNDKLRKYLTQAKKDLIDIDAYIELLTPSKLSPAGKSVEQARKLWDKMTPEIGGYARPLECDKVKKVNND